MPKRTKKQTRSYWMTMVAEYEQAASAETQEAFARRKQINVGTFRYWLYKGREAGNDQPVRFVEVKPEDVASVAGNVEVELGGGRLIVRFGSGADAAWIGQVVQALAVRLEC
jgi:hypothetical protein